MTTPAPSLPEAFIVELPPPGPEGADSLIFSGTLTELATALRAGQLLPSEVPLLELTRRLLERVAAWRATHPEVVAELLPPMAVVIALKARMLLPKPDEEPLPMEADDYLDDVIESVEALAELDVLVNFLSSRRREREGLIPAPPLDLGLPRRERKPTVGGLAKLVKAARNAVREVTVPLLARERLTLQGALSALRAFAGRLSYFLFAAVPAQDWGERTTYFAALLEGVKNGEFDVEQSEAYGAIQVHQRQVLTETPEDAHVTARSA